MYKEELQQVTQEAITAQELAKYDYLLTKMMEAAKQGQWQVTFHFELTNNTREFFLTNGFLLRGRTAGGVWQSVEDRVDNPRYDTFIVSWR